MARTVERVVSRTPRVKVTIGGSKVSLVFDCLVDTGFTGLILLPIAMAIPLGVELDGLGEYITADGTRQNWSTARATIEFQQQFREESVTLAYSGDEILLGLGFLITFQQSLIIHRDKVLLLNSADLDSVLPGLN